MYLLFVITLFKSRRLTNKGNNSVRVWFFVPIRLLAVYIFITFALLLSIQLNNGIDQVQALNPSSAENFGDSAADFLEKTGEDVGHVTPVARTNQENSEQNTRTIRQVVAAGVFSFGVVQQPEEKPFYVSGSRNLITEFSLPKEYDNIGLLAHNSLAGRFFHSLNVGQEIQVEYSDGQTDRYTVRELYRFRALEPTKAESLFEDLETRKIFTATELFKKMYTGFPHLTLQTCIEAMGDSSWGRLFVIAFPVIETETGSHP